MENGRNKVLKKYIFSKTKNKILLNAMILVSLMIFIVAMWFFVEINWGIYSMTNNSLEARMIHINSNEELELENIDGVLQFASYDDTIKYAESKFSINEVDYQANISIYGINDTLLQELFPNITSLEYGEIILPKTLNTSNDKIKSNNIIDNNITIQQEEILLKDDGIEFTGKTIITELNIKDIHSADFGVLNENVAFASLETVKDLNNEVYYPNYTPTTYDYRIIAENHKDVENILQLLVDEEIKGVRVFQTSSALVVITNFIGIIVCGISILLSIWLISKINKGTIEENIENITMMNNWGYERDEIAKLIMSNAKNKFLILSVVAILVSFMAATSISQIIIGYKMNALIFVLSGITMSIVSRIIVGVSINRVMQQIYGNIPYNN